MINTKETAKQIAERMLAQEADYKPPMKNYREVIKVVKTNRTTYQELVIATLIVEATLNGDVNAAKLILGVLSDSEEKSLESAEIPQE